VSLALATTPAGRPSRADGASAASGEATFSGIWLDKAGTGYTLAATSGTLTAATSSAFDVAPGATTRLVYRTQPANGVAGTPLAAVVAEAQDAFGNLTPAFTGAVRVALEANGLGATAGGTTQVDAIGGWRPSATSS